MNDEELTPEMQARLDQMWEEHKTRSGFPYIENIRDVLPAIEGYDEFIVVDKGDYTVINYVVSKADTFGSGELTKEDLIRRECRGITFCSKTGYILARKYHKFFNVGEREETLPGNFEMADPHVILDKLDGSMITPVMLDKIEWHTKMGATDVAKQVEEFVALNPHYNEFARIWCNQGVTLIFEWCSRKQQIVLDYAEDQLVLTGARFMKTGAYFTYEGLVSATEDWDIPVVENFGTVFGLESFMEVAREQKDFEGYVIRFNDGRMIKIKTEWYVQIHKAKEKILQDRHVVAMILDNTLDDVKGFLSKEDLDALNVFETKIVNAMEYLSRTAVQFVAERKKLNWTKKDFATKSSYCVVSGGMGMHSMDKALIFAIWDDNTMYNTRKVVEQMVRKNINSNGSYAKLQESWFVGMYR